MDSLPALVNTPTDGNPPAPINRTIHPPIGKGFVLEHPEHPSIFRRMRLTVAPELPVKHGNFDRANEARRSVHAGAMSHDCEAA